MKKATPPVHIPLRRLRQELLKLFNRKNPYIQPEEAVAHLLAIEEYRNDVFVEYCITAARVKAFFGSLLAKKKKLYKNCDVLPLDAVEGTTKVTYGQCKNRDELLHLVRSRNILAGTLQRKTVADLVTLLTEDDNAKADAENDLDQDEAHAAVECASENIYPQETVHQAQMEDMLCEELSLMSKDAEDASPDGAAE